MFLSTNENKQFRKKMAEGERYLEELDYVQAETAYLDAIEIDPKKKEPYMLLADIHVMQEDYDKAIAIAEEGRDAVPEKDKPEFESLIEDLVEESKNYEDGQPENDKESTEGENKAEVPESAENQYKDFTIGKMAVENGSWFAERLENTLTIYKDGKPVKIVNGDFEGEYGINATMVMNADGVFFVQEDTIQFYNFETGEVEELISDGLQPEVIGTIGNKLYYTMNDSGYEESDNMVICEYDFAAKKAEYMNFQESASTVRRRL